GRRLEQAQLVEEVAELEQLVRRLRAAPHQRAHAVDPADQLDVELGVVAEVIVDAGAPFQQARQDLVEVVDRIRIVETERVDGALWPVARAVPALALRIALAAEQDR